MISERKNDEIDSNSSESSPSRDTLEYDNSSTHRSSVEEILPTEIFDRLFDKFISANTAKNVTKYFQEITNSLSINTQDIFENGYAPVQISYQPISFNHNSSYQNYQLEQEHIKKQDQLRKTRLVYQIIKSKTDYWKADNLWKLYDKLAKLKEYKKSINSRNLNVLIIGAGPVGLRLSIECALLGYKCTVVEKRDRFSRNNVLHLWPYTIVDLKSLGAKMFYGKFCAGSIDHISIRKLQCVLLKAALLFGVKVHFNTSFEEIIEPIDDHTGWRVKVLPENHPLSKEDFDSVIGGDGRRNTLPGFIRKEFRGKLAIGITANFINNRTPEEADVDERSGVSYLFDQKFFNDIRTETNIDLENIVYYKDDTHYFVMTAKRQSLIEKGVILEDNSDPAILLGKNNVNHEVLCDFAKEAAYTSSEKKLNNLKFAKNHYGKPDVSMFDFTSLFQSENATRIIERKGKKLLLSLVGDSLLEPFWPTGSGIARGFLAAYDTAWALKRFGDQRDSLELLCERESIYQLLSQTTPENLNKNFEDYTIDPSTRYVNLNQAGYVNLNQVRNLYDNGTRPLASIENSLPYQNRRRQNKSDTGVHSQTLLKWCQMVVQPYSLLIDDFKNSWKDGLAFCAIIHRFRADLVDYAQLVENKNAAMNIKKLFDLMENKLSLEVVPEHEELIKNGINTCSVVLMILDKLYSIFKNIQLNDIENKYEEFEDQNTEIQNVHKRKYNQDDLVVRRKQRADTVNKIDMQNATEVFNPNKRNSLKHVCVKGISQNLKNKFEPRTEPFSVVNNDRKSSENPSNIRPKSIQQTSSFSNKTYVSNSSHRSSKLNPSICYMCKDNVSITDRQNVMDLIMHSTCFKCNECNRQLDSSCYEHTLAPYTNKYVFYCVNHKPIHKPDIRQKQVINNPIQKPDIRVDDRYNVEKLPKIINTRRNIGDKIRGLSSLFENKSKITDSQKSPEKNQLFSNISSNDKKTIKNDKKTIKKEQVDTENLPKIIHTRKNIWDKMNCFNNFSSNYKKTIKKEEVETEKLPKIINTRRNMGDKIRGLSSLFENKSKNN